MEFNPAAFDALLNNMGHQFAWRKSYACPCFNPGSGQAKDTCPQCGGKGRIWTAESDPNTGTCGFQAQNARKAMADFGVWEAGDSLLTIGEDCPFYVSGRFDRFRSLRSTHVFTDGLRRGFGDRIWGKIVSIDRVFWLDVDSNIVEGGIPTVATNGALTWTANEPPQGQTYSVAGERFDEYYAYLNIPQNRPMHDGARLPKKLPVRKFDLFGRPGN
jgi:hypothetical protein